MALSDQQKAALRAQATGQVRSQADRTGEITRVPFGTPRSKLTARSIPGYVMRWFNDRDSRVERAQSGGYEFVSSDEVGQIGDIAVGSGNTDIGSRVSRVVGTKEDGTPMRAYLMKIKQEWYDEDQRVKQSEVDKVDEAIRRGSLTGAVNQDGKYIPKGGINIS